MLLRRAVITMAVGVNNAAWPAMNPRIYAASAETISDAPRI